MAETTYATQRLDHLGIVAGICREIDLAGQIDRTIGPTDRQVSVGEAVQAMVLNALVFVIRPLYLTPEFFANKPLDRLLRPGLTAEMLNDDRLGRALDILYEAGPTEIFAQVASHALRLLGIRHRFVHLDTTSLRVEGEYEGPEEPGVVPITHGYSRDERPDLKQVVVALWTGYRSALPLWIQALDGNASDTRTFPQGVEAYMAQLQEGEMPYLVADSALYSQDNLQRLAGVRWLTRVPERIGLARALIEEITAQEMRPVGQKGYRHLELGTPYGRVRQRWRIVWSEQAERRERATLQKRVSREREEAEQAWKSLLRHEFPSWEAAEEAVGRLTGKWAYHQAEMRYRQVTRYYTENLRLKQTLGAHHGQGTALIGLGNLGYKASRLDEALDYYQQSLKTRRELGDRYGKGLTLANIGRMYAEQGDTEQATEYWR
jgi:transposase